MITLVVSTKGQIVLPAKIRRRLGLGPGARLELVEEPDGIKLKVLRPVRTSEVAKLAGMVKAPTSGLARSLEDFDPASILTRRIDP